MAALVNPAVVVITSTVIQVMLREHFKSLPRRRLLCCSGAFLNRLAGRFCYSTPAKPVYSVSCEFLCICGLSTLRSGGAVDAVFRIPSFCDGLTVLAFGGALAAAHAVDASFSKAGVFGAALRYLPTWRVSDIATRASPVA